MQEKSLHCFWADFFFTSSPTPLHQAQAQPTSSLAPPSIPLHLSFLSPFPLSSTVIEEKQRRGARRGAPPPASLPFPLKHPLLPLNPSLFILPPLRRYLSIYSSLIN